MIDLTTLEGMDSPGKVRALCRKARYPLAGDPTIGPVAAVCVYPDLVGVAAGELEGSPVKVASVATGFPSGRTALAVKLEDTRRAVEAGADEIDMVIDRGAFLAGSYGKARKRGSPSQRRNCSGKAPSQNWARSGDRVTR